MSASDTADQIGPPRPKRADARRNYEKVIAAAREAFAEGGSETSLEGIARRAQVGIGTLYRHFPTRQALLEAVYLDEVQALCRSAADLAELPPWDALVGWLHRFVEYLVTKQALAPELLNYVGRDAGVFKDSRAAFWAAGEPLLERAQEARVARTDTDLTEVIQMVGGIAKIPASDPRQIDHILDMALDGLRWRGEEA
ncbi:MAG: TetR/AcrR family transcriptional regulator [Actinomycetota bacterium]|nr:TetR/AcrR family transcriptional regulator [Actinomycetota bacterium]